MATLNWWESFSPGDCMSSGSWNDLIDYIQHSACTDFTIYSECTDTGQAFRFTAFDALSTMYGGADANDELKIQANESDACPYIYMEGGGDLITAIGESNSFYVSSCTDEEWLRVDKNGIYFKDTIVCLSPCASSGSCPSKGDLPFTLWTDCATEDDLVLFSISGSESKLEGSNDTGDDIVLKANSTDAYSFIKLYGNAGIDIEVVADNSIILKQGASQFFEFDHSGDDSILYGGGSTTNDLIIYANETDLCPAIIMEGNEGLNLQIKAGSTFEVSTCSDESLFEVDSTPTNKHMDFHCLDAHNFAIENRTADPSGPTCTGRIWLRTDLV